MRIVDSLVCNLQLTMFLVAALNAEGNARGDTLLSSETDILAVIIINLIPL
jgi:hypothetical protein